MHQQEVCTESKRECCCSADVSFVAKKHNILFQQLAPKNSPTRIPCPIEPWIHTQTLSCIRHEGYATNPLLTFLGAVWPFHLSLQCKFTPPSQVWFSELLLGGTLRKMPYRPNFWISFAEITIRQRGICKFPSPVFCMSHMLWGFPLSQDELIYGCIATFHFWPHTASPALSEKAFFFTASAA